MADHNALRAAAATADSAPLRRWSTTTGTTKLRDSCSACASSKVRCTKEKPACSRCAKRGTSCDYLVTKRPGRKQPHQPTHEASIQSHIDTTNSFDGFSWPTTLSGSTSTPTSAASPTTVHQASASELFNGLLSPVDTSFFSDLDPMSMDYVDLLAPSVSFSSDIDLLSTPHTTTFDQNANDETDKTRDSAADTIFLFGTASSAGTSRDHVQAAPLDLAPAPFVPSMLTPSVTTSRTMASKAHHTKSHINSRISSSPCACLSHVLDLLKGLVARSVFPEASSQDLAGEDHLAAVKSVNIMNKQTIDALGRTLQCKCSVDTYLLTIASLVVLKILSGYAEVAYSSPVVQDVDYDGEDVGRVAAQSVLGELHRVQVLVNQLALKLKACVSRKSSKQGKMSFLDEDPSLSDTYPSFFYPLLDQLEPEMRSRIRTLSSDIIALL